MKFGHLLKSFEDEAALPATVVLNYKKLKKLIKAQTKQQREALDGAAGEAAEAASGAAGSPSSDDESVSVAAPSRAAASEAQSGAAGPLVGEQADAVGGVAEEDREFIYTLNEDLSRINAAFMEQEEDAVIRLRSLQDRLHMHAGRDGGDGDGVEGGNSGGAAALPSTVLEQLRNEMVDFHGELVLLLHWSLVNYAAVAKILKKHDKLTGSRLRAPVLASVLHQPFLSTESISQLVKEAERHVQELTELCSEALRGGRNAGPAAAAAAAAATEGSAEAGAGQAVLDPEQALEGSHVVIFKRTRAALHMLNDMQEKATTPSTLLPPSTAQSDAAHEDKKQRTGGEALRLPEPQQQGSGSQQASGAPQPAQQPAQQQQQSSRQVEAV